MKEFRKEDFFGKKEIGGRLPKEVFVAIAQMTVEQAREAYPYRPNDLYSESRYGGYLYKNDDALFEMKAAKPCFFCKAVTLLRFLEEGVCPDCDGFAEYNGRNPHIPI